MATNPPILHNEGRTDLIEVGKKARIGNVDAAQNDDEAVNLGQAKSEVDKGTSTLYDTVKTYVANAIAAAIASIPTGTAWGTITGMITAQADLIALFATKEPTIVVGLITQYWRGDKTWQTLDKTVVGLGNADNTSDVNKPVSTAQATAIAAAQAAAIAASQPLDSDLTSIAALTPSNDDIIQRKAGAWTNRTIAQLKVDIDTVNPDQAYYKVTGRWYGTPVLNYSTANTNFALNTMRFIPIIIAKAGTISLIGININIGGTAGCFFRMGIYSSLSTFLPGALLYDSGNLAGDVAGDITAAPALAVTPGIYWLACNNNSAAGITFKSTTSSFGPIIPIGNASLSNPPINTVTRALAFGALPNPAGALTTGTGAAQVPHIMIQF